MRLEDGLQRRVVAASDRLSTGRIESFLRWYDGLSSRAKRQVREAAETAGDSVPRFLARSDADTRDVAMTDGGKSLDDIGRAIDDVDHDAIEAFLDDAPDAGPSLLQKLDSGADTRLLRLHEAGDLDGTAVGRMDELLESGDMDQADVDRMMGMLETKDTDPLLDDALQADDVLSVAEDASLREAIGIVSRRGDTFHLLTGDTSTGWKHIRGRHVEGSIGQNEPTSFFPTGQTIRRGGIEKTLDDTLDDSGVKETIMRTVEDGDLDTSDTGSGSVYRCSPSSDCYVPDENIGTIRVVTDADGRVITAYPEEGPNTPHWSGSEGWENV